MTWVPPPTTAAAAARARAALAGAWYAPDAVNALRRSGAFVPERAARRALAADASPVAVLMRLFIVGDAVPHAEAEGALGGGLDALAALELVRGDGDSVTATVEIVPHDELVIASDRRDSADEADVVPGLHAVRDARNADDPGARRTRARRRDRQRHPGDPGLTVRGARRRHRRQRARTRIRAAELRLNGRENVELRLGSLLEPVAGERFGLIVANPPYVISPESRYVFRDSGMGGD